MALSGSAYGWWTGAVRAVLPQRGALANAREAVQHDHWAAGQRREVAEALARADRRAAAPLTSSAGAAPAGDGGVGPGGASIERPAQGPPGGGCRGRVIDVTAHEVFADAAEAAVVSLHQQLGLDLWLVTGMVAGRHDVAVVARGVPGLPVEPRALQPWADSYGGLVADGQAPRVAPRTGDLPPGSVPVEVRQWHIAACVAVPLLGDDGRLLGTVCGVSGQEQPDSMVEGLAEVERAAAVLRPLLARQSPAWQDTAASGHAHTDGERDALTGMLNRWGWQSQLAVEGQRCHRYGRPASVVVLDLTLHARRHGLPDPVAAAQLRTAARLLTHACRAFDSVARVEGAQLCVLAVECDGLRAAHLAERLHDLLDAAGLTPVMAVASRTSHCTLRQAADHALEQASVLTRQSRRKAASR
jgi:diguanylate cyclase